MRIVMNSTPAQIGIRTTPAKAERHTEHPKLDLETEHPRLEMQSTLPKIQIDQSQCFSEAGLKSPMELTEENASNAVQAMYESIGRIVDQGNQLTDIHLGVSAIGEQAMYNAYDQFEHEFNLDTIPKSRPKIDLIKGTLNIEYIKGQVRATPRLGKIELNYTHGDVEIYMLQKNQLNIQVEGSNFDQKG